MFYAIGNIGSSKKTDDTRLTDMNDIYEHCIEIMDVELPLSDFPQDTMIDAMGYEEDKTTGEIIYTWAKDENLGILYEKINGEYVLTKDTSVDLSKTYYVDILLHDDFSEDYTYGWRYISDDEDENIINVCHNAWIQAYRFVTNSTDEEFKSHFEDYFVKDSMLYNYLFTTRYCMADNRAKNCFMHFGKTDVYRKLTHPVSELLPLYCELVDGKYVTTEDTEIDASKTYYTQYAYDMTWGYDMDTSMGLNNYGLLSYRYGLEDTDVDEQGKEVFRESDSTLWCRIRDLFATELKTMYNTLESQNAWHSESFLNEIEAWQNQFPEELWRIDIERKYLRSYNSSFIDGAGDPQFLKNMSQGKMKYAIKEWERSQEKYMASKYQSTVASSDNAVLRCTAPSGELAVPVDYKAKLTPYNYIYLNVRYGTGSPIQVKAEPGKEYIIPFTGTSTDIVDIYSASCLQSVGDLSTFYPTTVDTAKATRLKELHIGNKTEGYDNPYLTTMTLGANYLLEVLNVENVSGLTQSLNLSELNNLRELYAHGTNTNGVTFASGGNIQIAELPAITAMSAKNLAYLRDLDITSYDKLTTLTVESCSTIDVINIFELAPNLNRVRITGIDWVLPDDSLIKRIYTMTGIDKNGYNVDRSVLSGKVHIPLVKQQELYDYQEVWPDLEITYDTMIEQFTATFYNEDGTVLDVQYVDIGKSAVDPITREINPIAIPTKKSTVSHDYTYAGWDSSYENMFGDRTITATYTESLRSYTVKFVSKGITLQETTGLYGENVDYTGALPVYTGEEMGYVYYWFDRWDKSGIIDGDKIINAIFDKCAYTEGYFNGKNLEDLRPVEIYALTKLGSNFVSENAIIEDMDEFRFTMGHDVDYDDVESELIISDTMAFDGKTKYDTGITLFDEDRDFVLAIDYEFLTGTGIGGVLAQCFQTDGSNGFKLWYNNSVKFTWGTSVDDISKVDKREMVIIRHIKGEQNLYIYNSNLDKDVISISELEKTRDTVGNTTLVFGCAKADDGAYESYAVGNIHWCKLWYTDLGEEMCKKLALWNHEKITMQACGFRRYYLSENSSQRCTFTMIASNLLSRKMKYSSASTTEGGWNNSIINTYLNNRFYKAIPDSIRGLIKLVNIPTSAGNKSTEIINSSCYISIPSYVDVYKGKETEAEPYVNEGSTVISDNTISFIGSSNANRIRTFSNGEVAEYWTRTPNVGYVNYVFTVQVDGKLSGFNTLSEENGILIMISV